MVKLSVNVDHVATVRQARRADEPDPVAAAVLAELAGADGITCHLRGDRRHIQDADLRRLREAVRGRLNVEMAATKPMLEAARRYRPDLVTLVPERPGELTTTGGLDVRRHRKRLRDHVRALRRARIGVSIFLDPDLGQVEAAADLGVETIELNTNAWAIARSERAARRAYDALVAAAARAGELGLVVAAGHGLTIRNVGPIADIPEVEELNIGHSIVARATLLGMEAAVREMLVAMGRFDALLR